MTAPSKKENAPRENSRLRVFYLLFFYIFWFLLTVPVLFRKIHANDLWKALYSGRYLWFFHQFPHHSTFTFSPVVDFLKRDSFSWFGNLVFVVVHDLAGLIGQQGFRALVILFAVLVVHSFLDFNSHPAVLVTLVFFTYGIVQKTHVRTALFSVIFTPVLMWVWYQYQYRFDNRWGYVLPVIMVLWANMHGSYMVGFGLLSLLMLGRFLDLWLVKDSRPEMGRILLIVGLVLVGIMFVKPHPDYTGFDKFRTVTGRIGSVAGLVEEPNHSKGSRQKGPAHFFGTLTTDNQEPNPDNAKQTPPLYRTVKSLLQSTFPMEGQFRSAEFAFPYDHPRFLFVRVGFLIAAIGLLIFVLIPFPLRLDLQLAVGGVVLLGLGYLRTVGYIPMVLIPAVFIRKKQGDFDQLLTKKTVVSTSLASFLAIWVIAGNVLFLAYTGKSTLLTGNPRHTLGIGTVPRFDEEVAEWVLRNHPRKPFYNSYNMGSFLIWKWWPRKKVFIDSKFSAYHPKFQEKLNSRLLPGLLKENELHHAVLETTSVWSLNYFLPSGDWRIIHRHGAALVFERQSQNEKI